MRLTSSTAVAGLCAPVPAEPLVAQDQDELSALTQTAGGFTLSSESFTTADDESAHPGHPGHSVHDGHGAAHGKHAPIGVMGDHVHRAGEWTISVTAMRMHMQGLSKDGHSVSKAELFADGHMVAPLEMDMDMLMLGGMFAPTDTLALMVMVPWIESSMEHVTAGGTEFETEASGIGDVELSGLVQLARGELHNLHLNLGLSPPTGSIDETDETPMAANAKLPYAMQLGNGTFDLLPGLT